MTGRFDRRLPLCVAPVLCCLFAAGCVAPLGPGYTIEQQEIKVHFVPSPEPRIHVEGEYALRNTGNQPLFALQLRLPGRRFHVNSSRFVMDGTELRAEPLSWNPRIAAVRLPEKWTVSAKHQVTLNFEFAPPANGEPGLNFAEDAFFLPAAGWNAEWLPAEALFGFGGVPPDKWTLTVRLPRGFLAHASGEALKTALSGGEQIVQAVQTRMDHYPFVVAGRYLSSEIGEGKQQIHLWTRTTQESVSLKNASDQIARTFEVYNATFGTRAATDAPLWIVECPAVTGCFSSLNPTTAYLLGDDPNKPASAEMVSADTVMVDLTTGIPRLAAAAAPSLAASWLGYGQNPGFFEQAPPLSALPVFAAALGREALQGPQYRSDAIRRALSLIPKNRQSTNTKPGRKQLEESPEALRAKSFLFFYGLQDHFGEDAFRKAITQMLSLRRGRGFNITDLIAALWDDTHENAAQFVRIWMKRPGVPEDFRARYESTSSAANTAKETKR